MRSRSGAAPTSSRYGRSGGGAVYGSPVPAPATASSTAAVSRIERVSTNSCVSGPQYSPKSGPSVVRARLGFRPTIPHIDAGNRIDPPMSLPCATGTRPAATAAAEPPLEPPVLRSRSHGLCVAPYASGSVVQLVASSGVLVLPTNTKPAARKRAASQVSSASVQPTAFSARMPQWNGSPAVWHTASFTRNGTPCSGPTAAPPVRRRLPRARVRSAGG